MNGYDTLKYGATGIATPDMSFYDRLRAKKTTAGLPVNTITGVTPLPFKADGTPLISLSMLGNGQQTGTPSPDNPIMPTFCGVRTGNLFDGVIEQGTLSAEGTLRDASNRVRTKNFTDLAAGTYTIQSSNNIGEISVFIFTYTVDGAFIARIPSEWIALPYSFTLSERAKVKIAFEYTNGYDINPSDVKNIMLNHGSTALPYEKFGYKIPITVGDFSFTIGQTQTVFLGQVQTVRRIKKLVLTGEEGVSYDSTYTRFSIIFPDCLLVGARRTPAFCTHYEVIDDGRSVGDLPDNSMYSHNADNRWYIKTTDYSTDDAFKAYLASEYRAGHPVTIWYILAEPTTDIVNEPLAKIGTYADELHSEDAGITIPTVKGENSLTVETDLQPSSVTIAGHIKSIT